MSCNGCRVLRKGCSKTCEMRSCLRWIDSPDAQANATLFLAKFSCPSSQPYLIMKDPSLLYDACGRTVNPVNGAIGLLATGKWNICEAAVETVLSGGVPVKIQVHTAALPTPIFEETLRPPNNGACTELISPRKFYPSSLTSVQPRECQPSDFGNLSQTKLAGNVAGSCSHGSRKDLKLLNLFV